MTLNEPNDSRENGEQELFPFVYEGKEYVLPLKIVEKVRDLASVQPEDCYWMWDLDEIPDSEALAVYMSISKDSGEALAHGKELKMAHLHNMIGFLYKWLMTGYDKYKDYFCEFHQQSSEMLQWEEKRRHPETPAGWRSQKLNELFEACDISADTLLQILAPGTSNVKIPKETLLKLEALRAFFFTQETPQSLAENDQFKALLKDWASANDIYSPNPVEDDELESE